MKKILFIVGTVILLLIIFSFSVFILLDSLLRNNQNENKLFSESDLIVKIIKGMVNVDCDGERENPWYCDSAVFTVEKVEPYHDILYAKGKGITKHKKEFWWVAARTKAFWGNIYFQETDNSLPKCDEIKVFPSNIFGGIFSKCLQGGREINR